MFTSNPTSKFSPSQWLNNIMTNNIFSQAIDFVLSEYNTIVNLKNQQVFFPNYTKHDIDHLYEVLKTIEKLVPDEISSKLSQESLSIIIASVVFHDIGMLINEEMFKAMVVDGVYDDVRVDYFDKKTWKQLWEEYEYDSNYWDEEKKQNVFGEGKHIIKKPNFNDLQTLDGYQKKYIGEFIRQHHGRIAHEVALKGYFGTERMVFLQKNEFEDFMDIIGIVARSHSLELRDTFDYLKENYDDSWDMPSEIPIVYIMVLLRLADYLHISQNRSGLNEKELDKIHSPFSRQEHEAHRAIQWIRYQNTDDPEKITIQANPHNARTHVKIDRLVNDIQNEFDRSWAVLGEVYKYNYTLNYRRIKVSYTHNIKRTYVERQFRFRMNNNLAKLLVAPLYGDNPTYGVRELVQNAVDACRECTKAVVSSGEEEPHVTVMLDTRNRLFTVTDTGKGMTLYEIEHFFLTIGSSFSGDINWQKKRDKDHIYRTGRFGIGVLAAFLIGPKIVVETKSRSGGTGYKFEASLQDSFIEINKAPNVAFGTKIEIRCEKKCVEKLAHEAKNKRTSYLGDRDFEPKWFEWFIDKMPQVEYYFDNKQLPHQILEGFNILKQPQDNNKPQEGKARFDPVFWKPYPSYIIYPKNLLCCNGFLISWKPNKVNFADENLDELYQFRIPSLHITDIDNELPLSLQRNNIEADTVYAFEHELAREMYIDLMCQLMAFDVDYFSLDSLDIEKFYFHSSGFTPITQYAINHLPSNQIIKIGIKETFNFNILIQLLEKFPNVFFHFDHDHFGTYYNHVDNIKHDILIKQIRRTIKDIHYYYSYITIGNQNRRTKTSRFDSLFDKYIGPDPIIPYEINKRREKFKLLHQEYNEIINKYAKDGPIRKANYF